MPVAAERVIIRADGAARGNPGPAAAGAVIIDASRPDARRPDAPPLAVIARPLGIQTNNYAEYMAVLLALERAAEIGAREVDLVLDSKLVVEQLAGRWKVRHPGLAPLHGHAVERLRRLRRWTARHEPRAANAAADALANLALDDPSAAAAAERGTVPAGAAAASEAAVTAGRAADGQIGRAALGAACAIFDDARHVLLVRHTYAGNEWSLPGGHALPGESPSATARREVKEETGLEVDPAELAGVYFDPHDRRLGPSLHFVFRVPVNASVQLSARSPEIDEVGFWSLGDLPAPMSRFTLRRIRDAASAGTAVAVLEPGERD